MSPQRETARAFARRPVEGGPRLIAAVAAGAMLTVAYAVAVYFAARAEGLTARGSLIPFIPLGVVGIVSWLVWSTRWVASRTYRPVVNCFRATTSVVVPCYREDPATVARCLDSWLAEDPTEIIIVPDVADREVIDLLRTRYGHLPRVKVLPIVHDGKRSALSAGIRAARHEILVLTDSDTAWEPGLLAAVQMPFADPQVGGVGTRQNAYQRTASVWRRVADWQVNIRYLDYVPAESNAGGVTCLSGRTAAYRRDAVLDVLPDLEDERFLGRKCVAGDDGRLTWLILSSGYRTVYQSTAQAMSMFPTSLKAYIKQRVRWSRNSYRCYLTALWKGWLTAAPFATRVRVAQILSTPVTQGITLAYIAWALSQGLVMVGALGMGWLFLSRAIRSTSHLLEHPRDLVVLPVVTLAIILVALPIKFYAFLTMNVHGWLTRGAQSQLGGEGQAEATNRVVTA